MRATVAVVLAFAGALALGEAALRLFFHAAPQLEVDIYQREADGRLGLRPNLFRRHVTPLWDVEIRTNRHGRRDRTEPRPGRRPVVLGLGDSQAFAWGVEEDQGFYSLLESLSPNLAVVNAAVPGTGPTDYRKTFQALAPAIRPDGVIVAIFVGNDFSDAARGGADQYDVDRGLLVRRDAESPGLTQRLRDWAARRSHLLQLLRAVQFNLQRGGSDGRQRVWDEWMREFAGVHLRDGGEAVERGYQRTAAALDAIRGQADRMTVLAIPRSWQVDPEELAAMREALGIAESDLDLDRPQRFLREWCEAAGVAFADPLPRMRQSPADRRGRLFYSPDAHLAPAGHAAVAQVLAETLAAEPLQPAR